ncbi:MAG: aminotransferase class V-fold PLP-dependent enzyme [Longimicrobiales bacterium]
MRDDLVYLDYAATAAVRPDVVADAVAQFLKSNGATPGRGGHRLSIDAGRIALRCRRLLAGLLGIPGDPGRIAFQHNATHALNTALCGVLREGDIVVTTSVEHNAVMRPLHALARERAVEVRRIPADAEGALDLEAAHRLVDGARLLAITAASNVLGTRTPVAQLAHSAHDAGALVLVDAAQAAGSVPLDAGALGIDLLALTGHKALLGPQGVGALWVRPGLDVAPLLTGGTGGDSLDPAMPNALPDHLEAGTLNAPGIAGLAAALEWLCAEGPERLRAREMALKRVLYDGLQAMPGVRVLSPAAPDGVPIVTITAEGIDPSALASRLDREHGVLTRPGLHCAPDAHRLMGTEQTGAVRFSLGWASTESDVARALAAVGALTAPPAMRTLAH